MINVIFDELHSPSWTTSTRLAKQISDNTPENYFYGHLADLINLFSGYTARSENVWDKCLGGDLLVIAMPTDPSIEPSLGGQAQFTAVQIADIVKFVKNGGSLFVVGEYNINEWGSNLNEVCTPFGITMSNDVAMERSETYDFTYVRHIIGQCAADHQITRGVDKIRAPRKMSRSSPVPVESPR